MRMLQSLFFALIIATSLAFGQVKMFDSFDNLKPDTLYATSKESASKLTVSADSVNKREGKAALKVLSVMPNTHSWGTYTQVGYSNNAKLVSWGSAESLSIWINVTKAPQVPSKASFRMQVADYDGSANETWVYQQNTIIDAAKGWVNLRIPLVQRNPTDGSLPPDSTGFSISPGNWGFSTNNKAFDTDKLMSWYLTIITEDTTSQEIEVEYDQFELVGTKAVPVTIFNGLNFTAPVSGDPWAWGQSTIVVEKGANPNALLSGVKWVQGDEWKSGWSGWGASLTPTNMVGIWNKDTIKFKMKAAAEVPAPTSDSIRVQIEGGGGKKGKVVDLIMDGAWHQYNIPMKDLVYTDNSTKIDSANINTFGIMAEANAKVGRTIYVTDIWIGNPTFDVTPPVAVTGVAGISGNATFSNIVSWTDVPNEVGAKYNVYYSEKAFKTVDDAGVEDLPPYNIGTGVGSTTHVLRAPLKDTSITYYYGVNAKDQSGNVGALGLSTALTTKAKGVPTIALTPPANITIDGDVKEWKASSIKPFVLSTIPANGEGHLVSGGKIDGDADCKVTSYIAVDANNLYVAFDVDDDVVGGDTTVYIKGTYGVDGCDLFLGLYDWRGMRHTGYTKGATPDYHFRFTKFGAVLDNNGKYLNGGAGVYKFTEKVLTPGYVIEGKFPLKMLADSLGGGATAFVPKEGMRIPIDFSINDNDNKNPTGQPWEAREGIMCYGQFNQDNAWQDMRNWTYTWLGAKWKTLNVRQENTVASSFELSQNYPNPFNPTTNIRFSIPKAGVVSLKVFDILGREVMQVLNQYQAEGSYTVSLDASKLATGMYVYRLESGSFSSTKKMMLLK